MTDTNKKKAPTTQMIAEDVNDEESGSVKSDPVPAAAPLGTDAEAGGQPPSKEELKIARAGDRKGDGDD